MNTLADAIERLEDLGRAGFCVSIGYGPINGDPRGPCYSVMILHPDGQQASDFPVSATDFVSAVETAMFIITAKDWEDAEAWPRTILRRSLEEIDDGPGGVIRRKSLVEDTGSWRDDEDEQSCCCDGCTLPDLPPDVEETEDPK